MLDSRSYSVASEQPTSVSLFSTCTHIGSRRVWARSGKAVWKHESEVLSETIYRTRHKMLNINVIKPRATRHYVHNARAAPRSDRLTQRRSALRIGRRGGQRPNRGRYRTS